MLKNVYLPSRPGVEIENGTIAPFMLKLNAGSRRIRRFLRALNEVLS
jgi:hypothetical protein